MTEIVDKDLSSMVLSLYSWNTLTAFTYETAGPEWMLWTELSPV